jgi:hypothetical protein
MSSNSNRSYASFNFFLFLRLRAAAAGQLHKHIIAVVFVLINCIAPPACHFFSLFFYLPHQLHQNRGHVGQQNIIGGVA